MSDPRSVPEIKEALTLFQNYERSTGDVSSAKHFAEAVELLNDYLETEPNTEHANFIKNVRLANTRAMLYKLGSIDKKDMTSWLEHVFLILVPLESEAKSLMTDYPDLENDFNLFFNVWKEDLARALIEDEAKSNNKEK